MRPNASPKRGRGRSGGGGGGGRRYNNNSANRSYDSNGPDVKVRGTPMHIYDKYQSLARDASSAGDRIAAENYLQHAEHYYRIVSAANAQQQARNTNDNSNGQHPTNGSANADGNLPVDGIATGVMHAADDGDAPEAESRPAKADFVAVEGPTADEGETSDAAVDAADEATQPGN